LLIPEHQWRWIFAIMNVEAKFFRRFGSSDGQHFLGAFDLLFDCGAPIWRDIDGG